MDQAQAAVRQAELVPQYIGEAEAQVRQLEAQVALAHAQLEQAMLNLSWTKVTAPQDGWITKRNVEQGNYVQAGQSVLSIVTPDIWITANFKESQLDRMRPGQKVDIGIDAYPHLKLTGHVDSIQLGSGSRFTAFPPENATGNFVKIVQRVPVKILIDHGLDPALPLPLGLSACPRCISPMRCPTRAKQTRVSSSMLPDERLARCGVAARGRRMGGGRRGDAGAVHGDPGHHDRQREPAEHRGGAVGEQ